MEYLRLLYELPAITAGTTIVAYVSPWAFRSRFIPLVMFAVALVVLSIPQFADMALALTIPAAWVQEKLLGITIEGHEPLRVKLPVRRLRTLPVEQFVTSAFPGPGSDDPGGGTVPQELEPSGTSSSVKSFVPPI